MQLLTRLRPRIPRIHLRQRERRRLRVRSRQFQIQVPRRLRTREHPNPRPVRRYRLLQRRRPPARPARRMLAQLPLLQPRNRRVPRVPLRGPQRARLLGAHNLPQPLLRILLRQDSQLLQINRTTPLRILGIIKPLLRPPSVSLRPRSSVQIQSPRRRNIFTAKVSRRIASTASGCLNLPRMRETRRR